MAKELHAGFVLARKPGKLPRQTIRMDLKYLPKTADLSRFNIFSLLEYTEEDIGHTFHVKPSLFADVGK